MRYRIGRNALTYPIARVIMRKDLGDLVIDLSSLVHNQLTARDAADCHPLAAITDLALHHARHEAGGEDPVSLAFSVVSKIITFTKVAGDVTADTSYSGVGFQPSTLIGFGIIDVSDYICCGIADNNGLGFCVVKFATNLYKRYNHFLVVGTADAARNYAVVKSYDADGFTLTWTKVGSPIATMGYGVLCIK